MTDQPNGSCARCGAPTPKPALSFCSARCRNKLVRWRAAQSRDAARLETAALSLRRRADQAHDQADALDRLASDIRHEASVSRLPEHIARAIREQESRTAPVAEAA